MSGCHSLNHDSHKPVPPLTIKHNHQPPRAIIQPWLYPINHHPPSTNSQPAGRLDAAACRYGAARPRAAVLLVAKPEADCGKVVSPGATSEQSPQHRGWVLVVGSQLITSFFISGEPSDSTTTIHRASRARTAAQVKNPVSNTTCTLSTQQRGLVINPEYVYTAQSFRGNPDQ